MTDTITAHAEATSTDQLIGTLEYLDPIMLEIGDNVRDDAALSKEFLANITENGVLVPITGIRHPDNSDVIRVRNGQRRTLAAREVGLATVPVFVLPSSAADASEETIERIVHQIVTNDQKQDLTDAQRVRGIQQLLDAGVSVTRVARKLSVKKDTVKAAGTVGKSDAATAALSNGQLSLTEAAALTEFEDLPGALDRLTRVAGTPRFDQVVAQLREEQISWQAQLAAEAQWREKGFTVLDERPGPWDDSCIDLEYLRTADGASVAEDAVTDPAQWAVLIEEDTALIDGETGQIVDETTVDWNTQDDPAATPEEGMRHANTVEEGTVYLPTFYCLDYSAAGFTLDTWFRRKAGIVDAADDTPAGDAVDPDGGGDQAEAVEAAARAKAEAEAEAQRRERKKVIALNRLGTAATHVRRDFMAKLLTRKTPPKGASIFIASCVIREPAMINEFHGAGITADLLGVQEGAALRKLVTDLPPTGDARAQVLTLAVVLGALEARTPKDAWRFGGRGGYGHTVSTGDYLAFLVANGYELAEVERVIAGERAADDVYDETLSSAEDTDPETDGADTADERNDGQE